MASTSSVLRRALLYVPSSSSKFLQKSSSLKVDTICYDLEDSVTTTLKPEARRLLGVHLSSFSTPGSSRPSDISEISVRINAIPTGFALEDLKAVASSPSLDTIVLPKCNSAADIHYVEDVLRKLAPHRYNDESLKNWKPSNGSDPVPSPQLLRKSSGENQALTQRPIKILALIESARAVTDLREICAASPNLDGLIFAAEDFALDLSITRTPSLQEFLYARSAIATAARAYYLPSTIDLVCTSFRGESGLQTLEEECLGGRGLGFNGKQCIHPSQVEVAQKAFAPGQKEVEWAVRVVIGDEKADASGRGAWTLEGKMIDKPVVGKAKAIVEKANLCGIDVESVKETWKDQEPE